MAARQNHGFNFQKLIRAQHGLETKENHREKWDMEDPTTVFTSIKCMGGLGTELSSLEVFYENEYPYWWTVARHKNYRIYAIDHVYISKELLQTLKGDVPLDYVKEKYAALNATNWPLGTHQEAREWATQVQKDVKKFKSPITWLKKIDSKTQRRWQCSINGKNWNKYIGPMSTSPIYRGFDYSSIEDIRCIKTTNTLIERFLNEKVAA